MNGIMMNQLQQQEKALILRVTQAGQPVEWINWQDAVVLTVRNQVIWTLGDTHTRVYGGYNRVLEQRSYVDIYPIVASKGVSKVNRFDMVPPLTNRELFRRDQYTCMYCLQRLPASKLTRDHLVPVSRGGQDVWTNVVTACAACNQQKDNRLLQEISMKLHGVPYTPNYAEWLILKNRHILADQMEFLMSQVPKDRRDRLV
jgi:5-methylcytosine-specific restriction endonuclease McrA